MNEVQDQEVRRLLTLAGDTAEKVGRPVSIEIVAGSPITTAYRKTNVEIGVDLATGFDRVGAIFGVTLEEGEAIAGVLEAARRHVERADLRGMNVDATSLEVLVAAIEAAAPRIETFVGNVRALREEVAR